MSSLSKRKHKSDFQTKLRDIEARIQSTDKVVISSDKTDNYYEMEKSEYVKNMRNIITQSYRKGSMKEIEESDYLLACIAKKLGVEWRIERTALKPSQITVKDHKDDFPMRISFRLINPMKLNIQRVSKVILERVNMELRNIHKVNQCISTKEVIDWYVKSDNKQNKKFIQCDLRESLWLNT